MISEDVVDADKVDYVNRDALACGIPVGVDVARLFLRSSFFKVSREQLKRLDPNRDPMGDEEIIFVVNASGIDTIEELAQARSALYQRVYLHQATRNAERLLGHAIVAVADNAGAADVPDLRDIIQVWALDDYGLLNRLANHANSRAAALGLRLRTRSLPKRSCVFGRRVISTIFPIRDIFPAISKGHEAEIFRQITGLPLQNLREGKLSGQALRILEAEIVDEASKIAVSIRDKMPQLVPESDEPDLVSVLPMPKLRTKRKDCIILENNELCYSGDITISDEQAEGADIYKSLGYTMADPEWRKIVLLAAQTVLYRRRTTPRPMSLRPYAHDSRQSFAVKCVGHITLDISKVVRRVGLDAAAVQEIQKAAEDGGYYETMPRLASPISPEGDPTTIAHNLRDFCGQGNWRVTPKTCAAFIEQFPPGLRQETIELLHQVNILNRPTLSAEIIQAVAKYGAPKSGKGYIVALSPNSGNFVRMLMEQELGDRLIEMGWSIAKSIHEVFGKAKRGEDLILCDDNTVSGSQAECQFLAWFAIPRDNWARDQRGEQGIEDLALDDRDLDLLRSMHLGIAVCRGSEAAAERLGPRLKSLGIANFCGLYSAGDVTPEDVDLSDTMKIFLGKVGSDVLAYCRYDASGGASSLGADERTDCEGNSLGYGNARGLLSTVYNVPVSTLTPLWCPGLFNGEPWMPLLIRRGYLKHLVLA